MAIREAPATTITREMAAAATSHGLLRQLLTYVREQLARHGDLEMANVLLGRLRANGTGAARQRAVLARRCSVPDVVDWLAEATKGDGVERQRQT